jgi:hypothetical protein
MADLVSQPSIAIDIFQYFYVIFWDLATQTTPCAWGVWQLLPLNRKEILLVDRA